MSDAELRDMAARAAMAAMQFGTSANDMLIREEEALVLPRAGHHGYVPAGEGSSGSTAVPGCYSIESIEGGVVTFANPYLMVGGVLYRGPASAEVPLSCIVALSISATESYECSLERYADVDTIREEQRADHDHYIIPLYEFKVTEDAEGSKSVSVVCDFRNMPLAAMVEFAE